MRTKKMTKKQEKRIKEEIKKIFKEFEEWELEGIRRGNKYPTYRTSIPDDQFYYYTGAKK